MMQARPTLVFLKSSFISRGVRIDCRTYCLLIFVALFLCMNGCRDNVRPPTLEQIMAFEAADPITPMVDMERVNRAKLHTGPYRVVPHDVLEFTMPSLLRAVTEADVQAAQAQNGTEEPFICRVSDTGTITLPAVGELEVLGRSLAEIEEDVVVAYEPYVVRRPSIYARVLEYRTGKVYIAGAVETPGVYTLRADQMTLVSLLTEAGGISQAGAAVVRVIGSDAQEDAAEGDVSPLQTDTVSRTAVAPPPQTDTMPETVAAPPEATTVEKRAVSIRSSVSGPTIHIEASPSAAPPSRQSGGPNTSSDEVVPPSAIAPAAADAGRADDPCHPDLGSIVSTETPMSDETPGLEEPTKNRVVVLPVVGMNIPFKDISLTEGDTVVVEPIQMPTMSVLGLVRNPGNFPYPPYARYNLTQAIALAGGLAMDVDPRYVTVYRPGPNRSVHSLTFRLIEDGSYTDNLNEPVRPGDLIAVEHTPRTRTNELINRFFRFSVGTWVDVSDLWE